MNPDNYLEKHHNSATAIVETPVSQYAGFWQRFGAHVIDTVLFMLIIVPLLSYLYGWDYWLNHQHYSGDLADILINYIAPALAVLLFWHYRSATPGKLVFKISIVDASTLGKPSTQQFALRYVAYIVSMLPLLLGFFWVAWDPKKQGFHDKIAKTLVLIKS